VRVAARTLVIALVVGCGGAPVVAPAEIPIAPRPHAGYTIQAADLGDANILAKIPHHARLHRYLDASLEETGPTFSTTPRPIKRPPFVPGGGRVNSLSRDVAVRHRGQTATADPAHPDETELPWRETVPVLGATPARLRVVSDQDDARLAVWIDRADAAPVIVAETQLVDEVGHPIAVWLEPGVDLAVAGHAGVFTAAIVRVDGLQLTGRVRDDAIGDVWIGPDPRLPAKPSGQTIDPARLPGRAQLRAAPRADAAVLAETIDDLGVTILGTHGDWRELELRHQGVRVRGFVPASTLDPTDTGAFGVSGFGSGTGYGISDTDRFEVSAGACLYEREGGQVIGVNTKTRERYGHRGVHDEWPAVYVGTPWGLVLVRAHAVAAGWESCLP
jgi:hypothetical protein